MSNRYNIYIHIHYIYIYTGISRHIHVYIYVIDTMVITLINLKSWSPVLWHLPVHPIPGMDIIWKRINTVETCEAKGNIGNCNNNCQNLSMSCGVWAQHTNLYGYPTKHFESQTAKISSPQHRQDLFCSRIPQRLRKGTHDPQKSRAVESHLTFL